MQKISIEDHSVCQNFVKSYPDPPKIILKWFLQVEIGGIKKKSKKKDPFWGNLCGKVSSCIDNVYVLHIMPLGAPPFTAVDNGGDRSCQFLGLRPYIQILWEQSMVGGPGAVHGWGSRCSPWLGVQVQSMVGGLGEQSMVGGPGAVHGWGSGWTVHGWRSGWTVHGWGSRCSPWLGVRVNSPWLGVQVQSMVGGPGAGEQSMVGGPGAVHGWGSRCSPWLGVRMNSPWLGVRVNSPWLAVRVNSPWFEVRVNSPWLGGGG